MPRRADPALRDEPRRGPRSLVLLLCLGLALLAAALCGCRADPWDVVKLPTNAEFRDVFFLDPSHGWIVGGGHPVEGGILGETRDGGRTWRFRSGLVAHPGTRLFHLNAVYFHDPNHGLIAADGGRILRSVDGGEHWHEVFRSGRWMFALYFLDERLGWAAGGDRVAHTDDGGATWRRIDQQGEGHGDFHARAIHFVDARRGWLVGDHGRIHRSEDGGQTWTRLDDSPSSDAPRLRALHFVGSRQAWSVGEGGTILHSPDGGLSWTRQQSGTQANLGDIHFVDPQRGWAVGFEVETGASVVLQTSDGGASWTAQRSLWGEALQALFFLDERRGWAVGDRVRREPQRLLRYAPPED